MKKNIFLLLIAAVVLFFALSMAQEKEGEIIPPGMEIVHIRGAKLVVPEGMRYHKKGDLIVMESPAEYTARRLSDMEQRIDGIKASLEARLATTQAQIYELNEKIKGMHKTVAALEKSGSSGARTDQ